MACKKAVLYGFDGIESAVSSMQEAGCFSAEEWVKHEPLNATVDVNSLLFSEDYTVTHPIPLAMYKKIFDKHFAEFSAHLGRINVYTGQHLRYDHVQLMFRRVARACYDIITKSEAELILSSGIVHECVDTLLFAIAHEMGIHSVSCTPFFYVSPPCFFITENGESPYVIPVDGEVKGLDLAQFGFSPKALKGHASNEKAKLLKRILKFGRPDFLNNWYRHISFTRKSEGIGEPIESFPKDKRYAYYPLHYQPEAATCSMAAVAFESQLTVIQEIAQKLPDDYLLLLKENPLQTFYYRTNDFYEAIHNLPNVRMVRNETPSAQLLEQSDFAVTITGTVGWEALRSGKPVVFFGDPQYQQLDGAFRFSDELNLQDVAVYRIDQDKLQKGADRLHASAHAGDLTFAVSSSDENTQIIADSLCKFLNK